MGACSPPGPVNPQDRNFCIDLGTTCTAESPVPEVVGRHGHEVILYDEDIGACRRIATDSIEFSANYIDKNIVDVDYWITSDADDPKWGKQYRDFWINYRDGRRLKFNLDDIPLRYALPKSGGRWVRFIASPRQYFKRGGFIYPEFYGEGTTPTLIDIATTIAYNHRKREEFRKVAELSFQFAVILSAYAGPPETEEIPRARGPRARISEVDPVPTTSAGRIISERRLPDGVVIDMEVGGSVQRMGLEKTLPSGTEVSLQGWQRAHSVGPGLGAESAEAIRYAPPEVNLKYQNSGIERFVRDFNREKASDVRLLLRTVTETHPNSLRLKGITYRLSAARGGARPDILFEVRIEIENATTNPRVTLEEPEILGDWTSYLKPGRTVNRPVQ